DCAMPRPGDAEASPWEKLPESRSSYARMPAPHRAGTALAMTAQLIDGRELAAEVKNQVRGRIEAALARGSRRPALAVVKVGDDPASEVYVRNKRKACEEVGILSVAHDLGEEISEAALLALVDDLNRDAGIDGILVQLPLPPQIQQTAVIEK